MSCVQPHVAVWFKPDCDRWCRERVSLQRPYIVHSGSSCLDMTEEQKDFWKMYVCRHVKASCLYNPFDVFQLIRLPCGKCSACLMDRAKEWSARCMLESKYHDTAFFLTLTVDDKHMEKVFPGGKLCHEPWQLFAKSLRKARGPFRFLMCGEYGGMFGRPHYHALIFGLPLDDLKLVSFSPSPMYDSPFLHTVWKNGFLSVGEFCEASVQYVCRYVMKKAGGSSGEYIRMSTRPGIGFQWFEDNWLDIFDTDGLIYPKDYIYYAGRKMKPPRYFEKKAIDLHNVDSVSLKVDRALRAQSLKRVSEADLKRAEEYIKVRSHNFEVLK